VARSVILTITTANYRCRTRSSFKKPVKQRIISKHWLTSVLKSITLHNIFFKCLNKVILLAIESFPKTVLKSANAKTYSEFTDAEYELWL
jgi:hypothetical protein